MFILGPLQAEILYETDFDDFPTGPNAWAGTQGWISNDTTSGAQSIDEEVVPALFKTASLGFSQPLNDFTFVALNLGYDHLASSAPVVEIDALMGIEDSTNGRRDDFYLSIYNSSGNSLASIRFDNQSPDALNSQFGIWREDGVLQFDTLTDFFPGELFNLIVTIDLANNTWSADIFLLSDSPPLPLFTDAPFTATNDPIDLGFLAFEWNLSSLTPFGHGDNFLLVADVTVQSLVDAPELLVTSEFDDGGAISLSWETADGWTDQVEYSSDLVTWLSDLPNSTFTAPGPASFTTPGDPQVPLRYYRVRRTAR
jgi:hypothetical protein